MTAVLRSKVQAIRDHIGRIRAVDPGTERGLAEDLLRQESVLLNVQRACQSAIDLASHLVELPASARRTGRRTTPWRAADSGRRTASAWRVT